MFLYKKRDYEKLHSFYMFKLIWCILIGSLEQKRSLHYLSVVIANELRTRKKTALTCSICSTSFSRGYFFFFFFYAMLSNMKFGLSDVNIYSAGDYTYISLMWKPWSSG